MVIDKKDIGTGRERPRSRRKRKKSPAAVLPVLFLLLGAMILAAGVLFYQRKMPSALSGAPESMREQEPEKNDGKAENDADENGTSADASEESGADIIKASGESQGTASAIDAKDAYGNDMICAGDSDSESNDKEATRAKRLEELENEGYIPIKQRNGSEISLSFAGDILFDERYAVMASILQHSKGSPDISAAFDEAMLSYMRESDIFIINNEFPYSDRGEPREDKQFTFRARPEYAALLKDIGADAVTLANNHVNDYGREAMIDTFSALNAAGVPYAGAGKNIEEASRPLYFTNGDVKIAVISVTQIERMSNPDTVGATESEPGVFRCVSDSEINRLTEAVRKSSDEGCFVIVCIHWGTEGSENVDSWQLKQGKMIAEAGADLIIGNHPHVLERLDYIGDTPVIYSLGNYLFNSKTLDTCICQVTLDAETSDIKSIRFIPAIQSGCRTTAASEAEEKRIISHMRELSPDVSIDDDGYVTYK